MGFPERLYITDVVLARSFFRAEATHRKLPLHWAHRLEVLSPSHMSCSLNSLKGDNLRDILGTTIGVVKGDTESLDYSSHKP